MKIYEKVVCRRPLLDLNYRHDIVPVGYGYGRINIKNDKIFVTHPLCIGVNNNISELFIIFISSSLVCL